MATGFHTGQASLLNVHIGNISGAAALRFRALPERPDIVDFPLVMELPDLPDLPLCLRLTSLASM